MTRPPASPPLLPPQAANLPVDQMRRGIDRLNRRITDLEAFDPQSVQKRWPPEVTALQSAIDEALTLAFGYQTIEYNRYKAATHLDTGNNMAKFSRDLDGRGSEFQDVAEARKSLAAGRQKSLVLLRQAIKGLQEDIADREPLTQPTELRHDRQIDFSKVFVVHGHDEGAREAVARFLERLGIKPVILHEQANQGRTVIEKVEAHGDVGFAVVLLTPDDEGSVKGGVLASRARQNVLLELGYFIGRLGRKYVCALKRGEVEIPSDFDGVVYETFDSSGGWKQALGRELQEAGFHIDWNIVMRP